MSWLKKVLNNTLPNDEGYVEDAGYTFWGTRGSGILFVRKHPRFGNQFLAIQRSQHVEEPHTWGTSGGAVPRGESDLFGSAIRETVEELGSMPSKYRKINEYTWKQPGGNFTFTTFILEVLDNWTPTNFGFEVNDAQWVSVQEFGGMDAHFGLRDMIKDMGDFIYRYNEGVI